jgi:hypothetical protein
VVSTCRNVAGGLRSPECSARCLQPRRILVPCTLRQLNEMAPRQQDACVSSVSRIIICRRSRRIAAMVEPFVQSPSPNRRTPGTRGGGRPRSGARAGRSAGDGGTAALSRADILQRQGIYPPPPGASPYLAWRSPARLPRSATTAPVGLSSTKSARVGPTPSQPRAEGRDRGRDAARGVATRRGRHVRPITDRVLALDDAVEADRLLESSEHSARCCCGHEPCLHWEIEW